MTQQELTKKILRDAKQQAKTLVTAAEQKAAERIATAQTQAEQRRTAALAQAQADLTYRKTQQQRAHEVARIKAQSNAKQIWIDRAFTQAREKLVNADAKTIQEMVTTYTKKYAQPGDQILVAQAWSAALPDYATTNTIASGIIIENPTYRVELDIDGILAELKADITPTVAEILGVL